MTPLLSEHSLPAEARRARSRGGARRSRRLAAAVIAMVAAMLVPALALAHPLGNFTINHFAAIRIAPERISLDVVIDRAEIPAFQEVQRLDTDGNGSLGPAELAGQAVSGCAALEPDLRLAVDGHVVATALRAAGLTTPPGAGGLPTMRLVCQLEALLPAPLAAGDEVAFEDRSFSERIGWREIVVLGDGVTLAGPVLDSSGTSNRLTAYPTDLLAQPLDQRTVSVRVTPGGDALAPWTAPDAVPLEPSDGDDPAPAAGLGTLPGGVVEELAPLIDFADLTPLAILVSLAIAVGLGAIHALSPGHGKTIMAASLIGGRGTSRQAIALGMAVAVSHTLGVLLLAALTMGAATVLPPERLYPVLGVVSGGLVIAIGASLLWARTRELLASHAHARAHSHGHTRERDHGHADAHVHDHGHVHPHLHPHPHDTLEDGRRISWRGLVALGLSGGLVPSASALILLLGSIAAGRADYGLVLVLAFGAGMAAVLAGVGLLVVHARRLLERRPSTATLARLALPAQLATAALVMVIGVVLTGQALTQVL